MSVFITNPVHVAVLTWQKVYEMQDKELALVQNNLDVATKNNNKAAAVLSTLEADLAASRIFARRISLAYDDVLAMYQSELHSMKVVLLEIRNLEKTNQMEGQSYQDAQSKYENAKKSNDKLLECLKKCEIKSVESTASVVQLEGNVSYADSVLKNTKKELLKAQSQFDRVQAVFQKKQEIAREASKNAYRFMEKTYQWQTVTI